MKLTDLRARFVNDGADGGIGKPGTHRCKVCGALWQLNPPSAVQPEGSWSVVTPQPWKSFPGHVGGEPWPCGPCCDNVAMGEQIEPLQRGQGLLFDCPKCEDRHPILVWFANPLGGLPPAQSGRDPKPRWRREGETIETLTLSPSINLDLPGSTCHWHGWIRNGDAT